jgi:hypothetical protein
MSSVEDFLKLGSLARSHSIPPFGNEPGPILRHSNAIHATLFPSSLSATLFPSSSLSREDVAKHEDLQRFIFVAVLAEPHLESDVLDIIVSLSISFQHLRVRSHQRDNNKVHLLPQEAQMNVHTARRLCD